ncbi:hypothetical protein ACTXG6_17115 [Pseudonocardia sp. Cha107L01]|jgi:hypothetical protein
MSQPGIELVRDLIARIFNGHNPDLAPEDWIAFVHAIGVFTPPWAE